MVNVSIEIQKMFSEEDNSVRVFAIVTTDDEEYLRKMMHYHGKDNIGGKRYLHKFLSRLFKNHAEFYQTIGFVYDDRHHGGDRDFNSGCEGFNQFMKDYYKTTKWQDVSEESLQEIANVAMAKIKQLIQQYEQARNTHVSVSTSTTFTSVQARTETETTLDKIDFRTNDVLLLTGNRAYKITLQEAENVKSLNDIANSVASSVHGAYELQLKSKIAVLENRVRQLEQELEQAKQRYLHEGIKLALSELQDWRIEGNYAMYSKTIYVTKVKKGDRLYSMPESLTRRFYVKGLKVQIASDISEAYYDKAYHCNCNNGKVCIGSLSGQDFITVAKKLPETLKVMNIDSAFSNDATEEAEKIVGELEEEEEVVTWTT